MAVINKKIMLTLALFLASVSFLVYEVIWDRMLALYLGSTVYASTIVISAYMAGLAAGSFILGKKSQTVKDPSKHLALLLLFLAVINFMAYKFLDQIPDIYKAGSSELYVYLYSLTVVFLSSFFIGGIMPAVSRIFVSLGNNSGESIGNTFAADTIGSALGGLLAGFYLLGNAGMENSIYTMTVSNVLLSILIWLSFRKQSFDLKTEDPDKKTVKSKIKTIITENPKTAMLIAFISGMTGLIFQIVTLRIFKIYLTNTSYTFSLIVSVTIFGYFIGSLIFKKMSAKNFDPEKTLLLLVFIMGAVIASGIIIFANAPALVILPLHKALTVPAAWILLPPIILSLLTVLPQAILSGLIFTYSIRLYKDSKEEISSGFGRIYFINTLGAFIGSFLAAFILIPKIGTVKSLILISFVLTLVPVLLHLKKEKNIGTAAVTGAVISIILFLTLFTGTVRIMPPSFAQQEREVLFYKEAVEATIVVGKDKRTNTNYTYFNNNSVIGSSYDAIKAVKLLGHIPFLTADVPETALIVGFGIGVTTSTVLSHEEIKSVTCIELAKDLKDAAKYYIDLNNNVVNDPRLKIIGDDGRGYLQRSQEKYDLISSDPTHPVLGSGALYSKEYFQLCYDHLTDDGIVTQYLPIHKLTIKEYKGILKTFNSVFENTTVWIGHTHTILAGTKKPLKINFLDFKEKALKINDVYFYNDPYSLASYLILDGKALSRLASDSEICYDDRSYLDFFDMKCFLPENWAVNADFILNKITDTDVFYNIDDYILLSKNKETTKLVLEGLIQSMSGNLQGYVDKLREAQVSNPENQEIPFLLKLEGMQRGE
ncbi:MAG TPA: fused MFS/spermidine synthase [Clostridiales bacterium]|nr:fused MFS/spermidine synthase [Clostridiales bacterium]HQP69681.1 fused MFS/spermidine synthase [Clostridiales bacterium]